MNEYPRTPMRSYEKLSVEYLLGLSQETETALKTLDGRLCLTESKEQLQNVADNITDVVAKVLSTVPEKQLIALRRNLSNMEMQIRIKKASSELEPTGASYVDTQLLTSVLKEFSLEKCRFCLGGAEEQEKCRFKELLDEIVMEHVPEKPFSCKYRDAEWEEN